jgi:hypothetical protein
MRAVKLFRSVLVLLLCTRAAAADEPEEPSPAAVSEPPFKTIGLVTGGVGIATLLAAGGVGLLAKSQYDDAREQCGGRIEGCPSSAVADADGAYTTAMVSTALVIAGTMFLASGIVFYFLDPERRAGRVAVGARGWAF